MHTNRGDHANLALCPNREHRANTELSERNWRRVLGVWTAGMWPLVGMNAKRLSEIVRTRLFIFPLILIINSEVFIVRGKMTDFGQIVRVVP